MKFIDEVTIEAKAGHGGAGSASFRREKFIPRGGPDGGDGGKGGSIVVQATTSKNTLLDFRFRPQWIAEDGGDGAGRRKSGKDGKDILLQVPVGTEIYKVKEEGELDLVVDLTEENQTFVLAHGGLGGRGNCHFKSSTNQAPRYAQPGLPGEEGSFVLSLKLLADVGLVGLPNAGKSTFLSRISAAKPEIGDYPFTTKEPILGIVRSADKTRTCVVADIPGLIEGAHLGKGLGLQFLKHIERTQLLLHLVELSPVVLFEDGIERIRADIKTIDEELRAFSDEVAKKERLLVFTKADILPPDMNSEQIVKEILNDPTSRKIASQCKYYLVSAHTGQGLSECFDWVFERIANKNKGVLNNSR